VLIKAVAQAIPTFAMGCFDITKDICDQISKLIGKFWWSSQDRENKMHWVSWEKLTLPKSQGGLGFRDIHTFNLAMLAKQAWRLVHDPTSFCAQVLRAKYFPHGDVLKASSRGGMSYTWRSILQGVKILKNGMIWRVGNGSSVKIWEDPWLPREWTRRPITPRRGCLLNTVDELFDPVTEGWDEPLVRQTFFEEDVRLILSLPTHPELDDVVAWHYDPKGMFTVRSAYKVQREHDQRLSGAAQERDGFGYEMRGLQQAR